MPSSARSNKPICGRIKDRTRYRIKDRVASGLPPCALILDDVVGDVVGHMGRLLGDALDLIAIGQRVRSMLASSLVGAG